MISVGGKKTTLYHGDQHPAEVYGPATIQATGKNLLSSEWLIVGRWYEFGQSERYAKKTYLEKGKTYTFSCKKYPKIEYALVAFKETEPPVIFITPRFSGGTITFTFSKDSGYYNFYADRNDEKPWIDSDFEKWQLELGSVATSYEPYTGGKPGTFTYQEKYAGYDTPKLTGEDRIGWEAPYKAALPEVKAYGKGYQYATPQPVPEPQNGPIVTFDNLPEGQPLDAVLHIEPYQEGTGDPSPTNVRPIHGFSSVKMEHCGENLLDSKIAINQMPGVTAEDKGYFSFDGKTVLTGNIWFARNKTLPIGTYTVMVDGNFVSPPSGMYFFCVQNGKVLLTINLSVGERNKAFVIDSKTPVDIYIHASHSGVGSGKIRASMLYGVNTTSEYNLYHGESITVNLGQEVYGGEWEYGKKEMTLTSKMFSLKVADMNNSEDFPGWIAPSIISVLGSGIDDVYSVVCNVTNRIRANTRAQGALYWYDPDDLPKTQSEWKAQYPDLVVQVALPYREDLRPTITLPDQTFNELMAYSGINNLYHNAGPITVTIPTVPNPDHPVEPQFVENSEVMCRGRNLFDAISSEGNVTKKGLTFEVVDDGVHVYGTSTAEVYYNFKPLKWPLFDKDVILNGMVHPTAPYNGLVVNDVVLQKRSDEPFARMYMVFFGNQTIDKVYKPSVTFDEFVYEKHFDGGTAKLPILRALPDGSVKDEIDLRTGKITRRINEVVFNDKSYWREYVSKEPEYKDYYSFVNGTLSSIPAGAGSISNLFNFVYYGYAQSDSDECFAIESTGEAFHFKSKRWATQDAFIQWLGVHPITVWYPLATPIIEQVDPVILRQHPGYTQLLQNTDSLYATLDATVYTETKG